MMRYPDARILVFAKAPEPGAVMTRMMPRLGAAGAAGLHEALVLHTLSTATAAALAPVELWCAPAAEAPFFHRCAQRYPLSLHTQRGTDLGERMHHALKDALTRSRAAVLIGTDCPTLTATHLDEAVHALSLSSGDDAVVVPAEDGGYVLIGLRRPARALFEDIAWGTPDVMRHTRQRLDTLGWRWRALDPLADLDVPEDLDRLSIDADWLTPTSPLRSWLERRNQRSSGNPDTL